MAHIHELIERQRLLNQPPEQPELVNQQPQRSGRLDRLIADARAFQDSFWGNVDVVLGGEIVNVDLGMLPPNEWSDLSGNNTATTPADKPYRYDRNATARAYTRLRLDHEEQPVGVWQDVWDLLSEEDRTNVQAVIWWLNIGHSQQQLRDLNAKDETVLLPSDDLAPSVDLSPTEQKDNSK